MVIFALVLVALGLGVLVFGKRLAVLGAGVGALLGLGLLRLLNIGPEAGFWFYLIPGGLAALGALFSGALAGVFNLVLMAIGVLAGAAIALAVPDLLGSLSIGLPEWLLVLIGGVVGMVLLGRFKEWGVTLIGVIVGTMLTMRGLQMMIPSLQGTLASLLALVLFGGGIGYHAGWLGRRKQPAEAKQAAEAQPAAPTLQPTASPPSIEPVAAAPTAVAAAPTTASVSSNESEPAPPAAANS
jgi:hypothetical protein